MSSLHRAAPSRILHLRATPIRASPSFLTPALRSNPRTCSGPSSGRRSFHLGDIAETVGGVAVWTANNITAIHQAGIPWYLTIPLVAAAANFTVRLPLQYYTHGLANKRGELAPLVSAWSHRHAAAVLKNGTATATEAELQQMHTLIRKSQSRIFKNFGVQPWKSFVSLSSVSVFIVISDALRSLAGAPTFWVGYFMGLETTQTISDAMGDPAAASLFEPSLVEGGCLWFVDLTALDPYYGLPIICSALLANLTWAKLTKEKLRVLLGMDQENMSTAATARAGRALQRLLLFMPLYPLAFAHLPSAVFLYWATTFSLTNLNDAICTRLLSKTSEFPSPEKPLRQPGTVPYIRGSGEGAGEDVK